MFDLVTLAMVKNMVGDGSSFERYETFSELPEQGDLSTLYAVIQDNKFYKWDSVNSKYVTFGDSNNVYLSESKPNGITPNDLWIKIIQP